MAKKRFFGITVLFFVLIVSMVVISVSMKGNSTSMKNAVSGGDATHWYHSQGIIVSINNSDNTVRIIKEKDDCLEAGQITLNCSKNSVDISSLKVNQEIIFYYFRNGVTEEEVVVEKILPAT